MISLFRFGWSSGPEITDAFDQEASGERPQKGKCTEKSWYQYVFLAAALVPWLKIERKLTYIPLAVK